MGNKKRSKYRVCPSKTNRMTVVGSTMKTPFCAYRGSNGKMCPIIAGLEVVLSLRIPNKSPAVFMACPLHYTFVSEHTEKLRTLLPSGE